MLLVGGGDTSNKGGKEKTTTLSFATTYDLGRQSVDGTITVPENYTIITKDDDSDYEIKEGQYAILGNESYTLEISKGSYVYYTSTDYKEKHGKTEPSFAAYKEYNASDLRTKEGRTVKGFNANGRDVIAYHYSGWGYVDMDFDDYSNNFSVRFFIVPTNKDATNADVDAIINSDEFAKIITSVNIPKKD